MKRRGLVNWGFVVAAIFVAVLLLVVIGSFIVKEGSLFGMVADFFGTRDCPSKNELNQQMELGHLTKNDVLFRKAAEDFIRCYPGSKTSAGLWAQADQAFKNGNYAEAIKIFNGLLQSYPTSSLASYYQFKIAQSYEKQNKIDEAIKEHEKLIANYPTTDSWVNLSKTWIELIDREVKEFFGVALLALNNKSEAQAESLFNNITSKFNQSKKYEAYVAGSYSGLGLIYYRKGDKQSLIKTVDYYKKAAAYTNTEYSIGAQFSLGETYLRQRSSDNPNRLVDSKNAFQKIVDNNQSGVYSSLVSKGVISQADVNDLVKRAGEQVALIEKVIKEGPASTKYTRDEQEKIYNEVDQIGREGSNLFNRDKKYDEAINKLKPMVDQYIEDSDLWEDTKIEVGDATTVLIESYIEKKQWTEAENYLNKLKQNYGLLYSRSYNIGKSFNEVANDLQNKINTLKP